MNKVCVKGQRIYFYRPPEPIPKSQVNFSKIEFDMDETWSSFLSVVAQFIQNEEPRNVQVEDGYCFVPSELGVGAFELCLRGDDGESVVASVNRLTFEVCKGFDPSGETPLPPSPDLYSKLVAKVQMEADAAKASAETAKTEAENAQLRAEQAVTSAEQAVEAAKQSEKAQAASEQFAKDSYAARQGASEALSDAQIASSEAAQSAREAAESASTASISETNAKASEESAKASETAAQSSKTVAAGSASAAANNASAASESAAAAATSATVAKASETAAKASEVAAAGSASAAQQSATSAAESAAVYDDVVADVIQLKQDVAAITPDDTTVDGKPWTSKKIVDSLCQPFEESGNSVQVYPVENYPLGVKVSWEPVQEGIGDPSPDNIRPITGRDSVTVEQFGENLVKFPYRHPAASRNGLVMTSQQDGSITVNGTATADTWFLIEDDIQKRLPMNTPLTLSGCPAGGSTNSYYIGLYLSRKWYSDTGNGNTDIKSTTRKIRSRIEVSIVKGTVCNNLTFYPKIEVGTTITPYSKYQGSTNTLNLPETVYGGTLDVESGVVTVEYGHIASYAGEALPGEWISDRDVYSAGAVPTTGAQVVYKLAEPITIQLSPKQIAALSGVNTIYTDADGVIVTGAEDPKHTITELKNAIISLGGNI